MKKLAAKVLLISAPLGALAAPTPEEQARREQDALKRAKILRIVGMPGLTGSVAAALKDLGAEADDQEARIPLPADALFAAGTAELRAEASARLGLVAHVLREFPGAPLRKPSPLIPAYLECDAQDNALCLARTSAVKDWLVENGIDPARLVARAMPAGARSGGIRITVRKRP